MDDQPYNPEALSFPVDPVPGAILMILRECRVQELGLLSFKKERLTYEVRAFITDNTKVNYVLSDAVKEPSSVAIKVLSDRLTIYNHYGRDTAVFFDLVPGPNGILAHISAQVSATLPQLALGYAMRTYFSKGAPARCYGELARTPRRTASYVGVAPFLNV